MFVIAVRLANPRLTTRRYSTTAAVMSTNTAIAVPTPMPAAVPVLMPAAVPVPMPLPLALSGAGLIGDGTSGTVAPGAGEVAVVSWK